VLLRCRQQVVVQHRRLALAQSRPGQLRVNGTGSRTHRHAADRVPWAAHQIPLVTGASSCAVAVRSSGHTSWTGDKSAGCWAGQPTSDARAMPAGTSNAAPSATPARNARPRWTRASVIVGATPYKARTRHTRNPVSFNVCTARDAPTAMIAPASVGTSSSAVSNPQPNRRPGRPRTRGTRTAPASPPGLAAPGRTRVGARKERGGLTELNGAYQGREGLPKFAGASSYAPPGDHVGPALRPGWRVRCPGGGGVWTRCCTWLFPVLVTCDRDCYFPQRCRSPAAAGADTPNPAQDAQCPRTRPGRSGGTIVCGRPAARRVFLG